MPIPCYLALTAAEFAKIDTLPDKCAWMACHFSCYGTGLSNLPETLPEHALIILNDRTPIHKHDPQRICEQLTELAERFQPDGFLLDFQRADVPASKKVAEVLTQALPYPVAVTQNYAQALDCAVFLEAPPPYVPLEKHIASWKDRQLWLDAAPDSVQLTITEKGCRIEKADIPLAEPVFTDVSLHCKYHIDLTDTSATFTLRRDPAEVIALLEEADALGFSRAVGLYQQLK